MGVDLSEVAKGFGLRLCLRMSGGAGAFRFCGVGLACISEGAEYEFLLKLSVGLSTVSVACTESNAFGTIGSGFSISLSVPGSFDVELTGNVMLVVELEKDSVGSSKDTICGVFVLTSLPWRGFGAAGLILPDMDRVLPTSCCCSSSIGEPSCDDLGDS